MRETDCGRANSAEEDKKRDAPVAERGKIRTPPVHVHKGHEQVCGWRGQEDGIRGTVGGGGREGGGRGPGARWNGGADGGEPRDCGKRPRLEQTIRNF